MSSTDCQKEFDTLVSQGYRLDWVSGYPSGTSAAYAALWQRDVPLVGTPNPVKNPSFETAGPQGPQTSFTGLYPGPCAAAEWEVFNNTSATTTTELVPTTCPNGGTRMIHVITDGTNNGLCQVWQNPGGLPQASFSVWVYVVQGKVGVGIGHVGGASMTSFSSTNGTWEHLTGTTSESPVNAINIYSSGPGRTEYYVDLVSVS